jgi:hypothetical protein
MIMFICIAAPSCAWISEGNLMVFILLPRVVGLRWGKKRSFLSKAHSIEDTVPFPITTDAIMEYNLIACKVLIELVLARASGR